MSKEKCTCSGHCLQYEGGCQCGFKPKSKDAQFRAKIEKLEARIAELDNANELLKEIATTEARSGHDVFGKFCSFIDRARAYCNHGEREKG